MVMSKNSVIITLIIICICEMLFYIKKSERTDNGRWFVGRTHKGNDDRILYAYYSRKIKKGDERDKQGIYTYKIESAEFKEGTWIL